MVNMIWHGPHSQFEQWIAEERERSIDLSLAKQLSEAMRINAELNEENKRLRAQLTELAEKYDELVRTDSGS